MGKKFEKNFLLIIIAIGIASFCNLIRKPPSKEWLIVFLLKSYIASILDNLAVKKGYIEYPYKLIINFDISVIFSYLIYPISCVYFNQTTKNSNLKGILAQCLLFSIPSTTLQNIG